MLRLASLVCQLEKRVLGCEREQGLVELRLWPVMHIRWAPRDTLFVSLLATSNSTWPIFAAECVDSQPNWGSERRFRTILGWIMSGGLENFII